MATSESHRDDYQLGPVYQQIGDKFEEILAKINLTLLDPSSSFDRDTSFRLALITAFQYAEILPDPAAAHAARSRNDWKSALHTQQMVPGITAFALCGFRQAQIFFPRASKEFAALLGYLQNIGLYAHITLDCLDPLETVSAVCLITRFYYLNLAMKSALSSLVSNHPDWLRSHMLPHWYDRYKSGHYSKPVYPYLADIREGAVQLHKDLQHLLSEFNKEPLPDETSQTAFLNISRLLENEFITIDDQIIWQQPDCKKCSRDP